MEETVEVICTCAKGSNADKLIKVVAGALAGWAAERAVVALYDELIIEGRLKKILKTIKK